MKISLKMSLKNFNNIAETFSTASWPKTSPNLNLCFIKIANHLPELYKMTLRLIVLPLKDINYVLHIINLSQILIMTVPCRYKVLVFILVAISLLIDCTKCDVILPGMCFFGQKNNQV